MYLLAFPTSFFRINGSRLDTNTHHDNNHICYDDIVKTVNNIKRIHRVLILNAFMQYWVYPLYYLC